MSKTAQSHIKKRWISSYQNGFQTSNDLKTQILYIIVLHNRQQYFFLFFLNCVCKADWSTAKHIPGQLCHGASDNKPQQTRRAKTPRLLNLLLHTSFSG